MRNISILFIAFLSVFVSTKSFSQAMPVFNDPLRIREVESYTEKLDLSTPQKEAVLQAYDQYVVAFERVREGEIQKFEDLVTDFAERFGFMQFQIPEREEIHTLISKGKRAMKSIERVDNAFFDSIIGMLTETQQRILKRIRNDRELSAYRIIVLEMLKELNKSARPNLTQLVNSVLESESPEIMNVLETYERRMVNLAKDSLDTMIEVIDLALDMVDEMGLRGMKREEMIMMFIEEEKMIDLKAKGDQLLKPLQEQAFEISELNWKTWKQIDSQIDGEFRRPLAIKYFSTGFRDSIKGYANLDRRFEKAFDLGDLSEGQKQELLALRSDYDNRSLSLSTKFAKILVQQWKYRTIDQQSGVASTEYDSAIEQADASREKLVDNTRSRLDGILGASLVAVLDDKKEKKKSKDNFRNDSSAGETETIIIEDDQTVVSLFRGVEIPKPMTSSFATKIASQLGLDDEGEDIVTALFNDYREKYDELHKQMRDQSLSPEQDTTLGFGARLRKRQELTDKASKAIEMLDTAFFDDLAAVTGFARDDRFVLMLEQFRMRKRISRTSSPWGYQGKTLDLVDIFIVEDEPLSLSVQGSALLEKAMLSYRQVADELFMQIAKTEYDMNHISDGMMLANEMDQSASSAKMVANMQMRWRDAFAAIRAAKQALARGNQELVTALLVELPKEDYWALRMHFVKAAYPKIFKDKSDAKTMLAAAVEIPSLDSAQQGEITRMAEQYRSSYWDICESMITINESVAFAESDGKIMTKDDMKRSIEEEKLKFQRSELNDRIRMRLRMVLNEDQIKQVPGLRPTVTASAEK